MKTFASDWSQADEENRMPCKLDPVTVAQLPSNVEIPFPKAAQQPASGVSTNRWVTPKTLSELAEILKSNQNVRLVHANTSYGIYKNEYLDTTFFVDIRLIPDLNTEYKLTDDYLQIVASTTYSELIEILSQSINKLKQVNRKT